MIICVMKKENNILNRKMKHSMRNDWEQIFGWASEQRAYEYSLV